MISVEPAVTFLYFFSILFIHCWYTEKPTINQSIKISTPVM